MTSDQLNDVLMLVFASNPSWSEKDPRPTFRLWEMMFSDIPKEKFEKAVARVITTSKFFPTVAEIMENLNDHHNPVAIEAWGEVTAAVKKFGWVRPEEAHQSLSPLTRKVVESIGWMEICQSEESDVIRGQFMNHYNSLLTRTERIESMPERLLHEGERKYSKSVNPVKQISDCRQPENPFKLMEGINENLITR